jgi:hypothetical protein
VAGPRLPDAALILVTEARAASSRADTELSDVDARIKSPPATRNAVIYAAYAALFVVLQLPMFVAMAASDYMPAVIAAPCGLSLVGVSFVMAWLTIGFAYEEPGGRRPPRTPVLGALISLIVAIPGILTAIWAVLRAVSG